MTSSRWEATPLSVRVIVGAAIAVLGYGTIVHLVQLLNGVDPHSVAPTWLTVYFLSLVVLDPLSGTLLALRRHVGLLLACAVMVSDAMANLYANYVLVQTPGVTAGRVASLAAALLVSVPRVSPWLYTSRFLRRG